MKQNYFALLSFSLFFCASEINAQVATQIYDHDTTDLSELFNMPFDETRLLVVSGNQYSPNGVQFSELNQSLNSLDELSYSNVDTIWSSPKFKDDKMFFVASVTGLGREMVAYDGTTLFPLDFNLGTGSSNPEIFEFENEIYAIAFDGSIRQLFKYTSGSSFEQISEETVNDVVDFIANRGNEDYYITFSAQNGRFIMSTENNNGVLTHNLISPTSFQETLGNVVLLNGDIFMLSYFYTFIDASYRVDKIDLNNLISTQFYEEAGPYSFARTLEFDGDLLYYRVEPGHTEVLNISSSSQSVVQVSLDPNQYNLIGNHVVLNDKLFLISSEHILEVSGPNPITLVNDGSLFEFNPAFVSDFSFYLYEITTAAGQNSGIIEVSALTNQVIRYPATTEGGFMNITHPMVENNGEMKFILRSETMPSTDIYSFSSELNLDENTSSNFQLFPNPTENGRFSIDVPQKGELTIFSVDGKMIQSKNLDFGMNEIVVNDLKSGIYLVKFADNVQRLLVN